MEKIKSPFIVDLHYAFQTDAKSDKIFLRMVLSFMKTGFRVNDTSLMQSTNLK
jgi:hypothetical protein